MFESEKKLTKILKTMFNQKGVCVYFSQFFELRYSRL